MGPGPSPEAFARGFAKDRLEELKGLEKGCGGREKGFGGGVPRLPCEGGSFGLPRSEGTKDHEAVVLSGFYRRYLLRGDARS